MIADDTRKLVDIPYSWLGLGLAMPSYGVIGYWYRLYAKDLEEKRMKELEEALAGREAAVTAGTQAFRLIEHLFMSETQLRENLKEKIDEW